MQQNIPVLTVCERSLAQAYEKALVTLYQNGVRFKTQYDKPGDPPSIDSTMNITVLEPFSRPDDPQGVSGRHRGPARNTSWSSMGAKDHWVKNMNDPQDTRWEYTYHGRLAAYGAWREWRDGKSRPAGFFSLNQIDAVIAKLVKQPFTRQAQMITWMPNLDLDCYDPPCLQSLWYRIMEDDAGIWWLNCNVRFRSNDAWGANFMNMFGFIQFNREIIGAGVARKAGRSVELGRMNWHADSYHIYGKDIDQARRLLFDRLDTLTFEERTFNFHDPFIQEMYHGAEAAIREKIKNYDSSH